MCNTILICCNGNIYNIMFKLNNDKEYYNITDKQIESLYDNSVI